MRRHSIKQTQQWGGRPSPTVTWHPGFTLIEVLVVIGILGLLVGLVVVFLSGASESARNSVNIQFMNRLVSALNAYQTDMKQFPRSLLVRSASGIYAREQLNPYADENWEGAETLTLALIGHLPADPDNNGKLDHNPTSDRELGDGKDGTGFRLYSPRGRAYGPYMDMDNNDRLSSGLNTDTFVFTDMWDKPILYYAAKSGGETGRMTENNSDVRIWGPKGRYDTDHNPDLMAANLNPATGGSNTTDGQFALEHYWSHAIAPGPNDDKRESLERSMRAGMILLVSAGEDERFGPADDGDDGAPGTDDDPATDDVMVVGP
ncbi:MAG: hypothetical protein CMJ49_14285 [Planctomycetaceae bacterium]|nr:hypothetical protein [Planctomycetaceae bacterium]